MAASSGNDSSTVITPAPFTLLKNGFIVDGTGKPGFYGNLLIKDGRIKEISKSPVDIDCETLDCTGLVIAPGFIDAHSHMDWILPLEWAESLKSPFTAQGITTFVTGNCGFSPGGFKKDSPYKHMIGLGGLQIFDLDWDDMDGYFQLLEKSGLSHNVVHLAGHGNSQLSIRGLNPNPLDTEE
jgi:N-acyl-D-amino-acid deacylase